MQKTGGNGQMSGYEVEILADLERRRDLIHRIKVQARDLLAKQLDTQLRRYLDSDFAHRLWVICNSFDAPNHLWRYLRPGEFGHASNGFDVCDRHDPRDDWLGYSKLGEIYNEREIVVSAKEKLSDCEVCMSKLFCEMDPVLGERNTVRMTLWMSSNCDTKITDLLREINELYGMDKFTIGEILACIYRTISAKRKDVFYPCISIALQNRGELRPTVRRADQVCHRCHGVLFVDLDDKVMRTVTR
jgi:hypothetical protein